MRTDRLETLKEAAARHSAKVLPSPAWVWFAKPELLSPGILNELPSGAIPCAAGLLPEAFPEHWCWFVEISTAGAQDIVPVYKGSALWSQKVQLMRVRQSSVLMTSVWRQVAEWFETSAEACHEVHALGDSCGVFVARN